MEERDEVTTGMACGGLAVHAAGGVVERRIEREHRADSIQNRGALRDPAKEEAPGPIGPTLGWQSSRRRRT